MKVIIPYAYNKTFDYVGYFTICDIDDGITLCRRLGFEVSEVIFGEFEWKEAQNFAASGVVGEGVTLLKNLFAKNGLEINFKKSKKQSELSFICYGFYKPSVPKEFEDLLLRKN